MAAATGELDAGEAEQRALGETPEVVSGYSLSGVLFSSGI
jgi:hypothetical protein